MTCEELAAHLKQLRDEILKRNTTIAGYRNNLKVTKPEDVIDVLHSQNGIDKPYLKTDLNSAEGHLPDAEKIAEASDKVADGALDNIRSAQSDPKGWMGQKVDNMRTKFRNMFDRAFNYRPRNANPNFDRVIKDFAADRQLVQLGKESTYAGSVKDKMTRIAVDDLYSRVGKDSGMNKSVFSEMMLARYAMRGKDVGEFIKDVRNKIATDNPTFGKQAERLMGLVEQAYSKPHVAEALDSFFKNEYKDLDVAQRYAIQKGILRESVDKDGNVLPAGREDYTASIIALRNNKDPWDEGIYGKELTTSYFAKKKTYNNSIEAMLAGYMPASLDYRDVAGHYWRTYANTVRMKNFAENLRENGSLPTSHDNRMLLEVSADHSEPAVITKDFGKVKWETPESSEGKTYRELSNVLGKNFEGIYAHPDVYKWAETTFKNVNTDGIFKTVLKYNNILRGVVLRGASIYHGISLAQKSAFLGTATGQGGIKTFFDLKTIMGEGLSTVNEGQHFGILEKAIRNGFTLDSYDMLKNSAFNREYNIKTGELTAMSRLNDVIAKVTDWGGHSWLFEKARPGVKVGMLTRLVNSEYFENLKSKYGGDEEKAYQTVSQLLNDHFGGQNLEMIGRAKWVQTLMQASLLAPDWTESKMRRMFGAALNNDKQARKAMQISLVAEFGTLLLMKPALQAVASAVTGNDRTLEQQGEDALDGKIGSVYMGKTAGKKPKDIWMNVSGTGNQDYRVIASLAKGIMDTMHGDLKALPREGANELLTRASPALNFIGGVVKERPNDPKDKVGPRDYPFLPIGAQSTIYAARGGLGGTTPEDITLRTLGAAAASTGGMPLTTLKSMEQKKKEAKSKEKSEKKKDAKKRNLSLME